MDPRLKQFLVRPIAHRGLHEGSSGVYENGLLAFELALKEKFPIECDLRLTRDGEVVVFHDHSTERLCGEKLIVEEASLSALKKLRIKETSEGIPLLKELLELASKSSPLLLELKVPKFNGELERKVRDLIKGYEETVAIQSFHHISMWWWKENAPAFLRGMVSGDMSDVNITNWQRFMVENLMLIPMVKPHFIAYQGTELSTPILSLIDTPIFAWTARSQKDHDQYLMNGASNVIFEGYKPR